MSYKVGKGLPEIETEGKNKLDNPHFSSWLNEPELRNISLLEKKRSKPKPGLNKYEDYKMKYKEGVRVPTLFVVFL